MCVCACAGCRGIWLTGGRLCAGNERFKRVSTAVHASELDAVHAASTVGVWCMPPRMILASVRLRASGLNLPRMFRRLSRFWLNASCGIKQGIQPRATTMADSPCTRRVRLHQPLAAPQHQVPLGGWVSSEMSSLVVGKDVKLCGTRIMHGRKGKECLV